jgi:hypothetical protein
MLRRAETEGTKKRRECAGKTGALETLTLQTRPIIRPQAEAQFVVARAATVRVGA